MDPVEQILANAIQQHQVHMGMARAKVQEESVKLSTTIAFASSTKLAKEEKDLFLKAMGLDVPLQGEQGDPS